MKIKRIAGRKYKESHTAKKLRRDLRIIARWMEGRVREAKGLPPRSL